MHSAEAPKIHGRGQTELLDYGLEPASRGLLCICENEIIRFPILRPLPSCIQNRLQDSVGIELNAPATCTGLGIIEFAFVETFHDFDSILTNSLPAQSGELSEKLYGTSRRGRSGNTALTISTAALGSVTSTTNSLYRSSFSSITTVFSGLCTSQKTRLPSL
jgi:hypothetical protein